MTRGPGAIILAALRREPPRWALDRLSELGVIELAEVHGILPLIAEVATQHGLIPEVDSSTLRVRRGTLSPRAVLLAARGDNRARHEDLDAIRGDAERALRARGVAYRHLKGGALRKSGVWSDFTARPTRDVDILVGDARAIPRVEADLIAAGFQRSDEVETNQAWQDDHHELPLVHKGRAGSLELHAASLVRRHRGRIALDVPSDGSAPDLATTLRHIIIHAQLQDDALLQWRLPIVSLLDVAFALETGLMTAATLVEGMTDRSARRAARLHLGLVAHLRGTRIPGSARVWFRWRLSGWLFGRPRAAYLVRELAFAPRALSRPVMSAREGRELRGFALARARVDFLRTRIPRGARGAPQSGRGVKLNPAEAVGPMGLEIGTGADRMGEQVSWTASPVKADGFEAVWSSSGLVLVDLEQDVLHHLNEPAAVVYDLVGDRSAGEIADAFAALAELTDADARDATAKALAALAAIGAITDSPTND